MSLKAWAGLLGEFGRQSEAYASRQQELEDKRMEEERENRRLQALIAKEQGMARFNVKLGQEAAEHERNRPLTDREQALYDEELAGKKAARQYKESMAQYYSGGVDQVQALAEQIAEEQGISVEEALPLAQARIPAAGRRGSSAGGKSAGTAGALKLGNADLVKDEKDELTGKTFKRYLNGAKVPDYSEDEFVQIATERANAWREQKGKGSMNAKPSEEDTSAFMAEQLKALKEANAAQHKAAFEASRRQLDEFNSPPGGLIAPQGKTGQPEAPGKQPSLTDKIGKPNANATIDFEAALQSMWDVESNSKDFTEKGEFVTSKKGARGKSQVMPKTADAPGFGIKPADLSGSKEQQAAELNRVGKEYLRKMIEKYDNNLATAYAAYNMGPPAMDKWLESGANPADLPKETRDYVGKTMAKYESYVSKKSNVLEGKEPQVAGEPGGTDVAPGKMPQEWVNGVLSRADREREASKQQSQKKGLLADPPPSPFGGFEAAASAGMAPGEETGSGRKWYESKIFKGSLDAGELASKPFVAAGEAAAWTAGKASELVSELQKSLTEQEFKQLQQAGDLGDGEFLSILAEMGIAGVKAWLDAGSPSKNAERFYGKPTGKTRAPSKDDRKPTDVTGIRG